MPSTTPHEPDKVGSRAEDKFEEFYAAQIGWARRLAYVTVRDAYLAEEVAQESFVRMQPRFASIDQPRAYLRAVIVNHGKRRLRLESRQRDYTPSSLSAKGTDQYDIEILDLVDRLPDRQRIVLILRYFECLSQEDAARVLGCRIGTVKSLTNRALNRLRKELER